MKRILLVRNGLEGRVLAHRLARLGLIHSLVIETGRAAKVRKFKRHMRGANPLNWPSKFLDLVALYELQRQVSHSLEKALAPELDSNSEWPGLNRIRCDDINENKVVEFIEQQCPEQVLVFGTSIIKSSLLRLCPLFINIHNGIVPLYRNVHSEFWALKNGDLDNIGTSILVVENGIDNGRILSQQRLTNVEGTSLGEIRVKNFNLGVQMLVELLESGKDLSKGGVEQRNDGAIHQPTPGWRDIWK